MIKGKLSGISRTAYVYLPPQYFQPRYASYRFPAIELLPGSPGAPEQYITRLPAGALIPQFFLAAGAQDAQDVRAAESFRQELQLYLASVPLVLIRGASHDARAWRGAERPMFGWMTPQLAHQAALADSALAARERASRVRHREHNA